MSFSNRFLNVAVSFVLVMLLALNAVHAADSDKDKSGTQRPTYSLAPVSIKRVSVGSSGEQGNNASEWTSMSRNGRYVVFLSGADNLVAGDTNDRPDIFRHDLQTGQTIRVNVGSGGEQANGSYPNTFSINADGRYVVFASSADNLISNDANGKVMDVFVRDCQAGQTSLASINSEGEQGNGLSVVGEICHRNISDDGRYVVFSSSATNLFPDDTNNVPDLLVHDRQTGENRKVDVSSSGEQADSANGPSISADGRYVAFSSFADNLVPGDTNEREDVFIHDLRTGQTSRVSVNSNGEQADENKGCESCTYCSRPSISADGRYVVFNSIASDLVEGDTNGVWDIFVHDRQTGQTRRASISSDGKQANANCVGASISSDGQRVVFHSGADNLVEGDTNGVEDVFLHDLQTGETIRVSVTQSGDEANGQSCHPDLGLGPPSISGDGKLIAFHSEADNLVANDTNGTWDVFVVQLEEVEFHVASTNPPAGEIVPGAGVLMPVTATFNEPADPATVNETTFTLSDGTNAVAGTVQYDAASRTATFTPSQPLEIATFYTATLTTGVKNLLEESLASDHVWSFTTFDSDGIPLAGLRLWLKADTGITQNSSHQISKWEDQGELKLDIVQTLLDKRPLFVNGAVNERPVVRFDADDILETENNVDLMDGSADAGLFVVLKPGAAQEQFRSILSRPGLYLYHANQCHFVSHRAYQTLSADQFQLFTGINKADAFHSTYLNGGGRTVAPPYPLAFLPDPVFVSGQSDIAEIILYNRVVQPSERLAIENYLAWKYGISLQSDPSGLYAEVRGPYYSEAGGETEYTLFYGNNLPYDAKNVVLQVSLPGETAYVSSQPEGIYRYSNHEVFWKLGTLGPGEGGSVRVTAEYLWGIAPHTRVYVGAGIDAVNAPEHVLENIDDYLQYTPLRLVSRKDLTAKEIRTLLDTDAEFNTMYQKGLSLGFSDFGVATEEHLSDNSVNINLLMLKPASFEVLALRKSGDRYFSEQYVTRSLTASLSDDTGGMTTHLLTGETEGWGTWEGVSASALSGAELFDTSQCKPTMRICVQNCLAKSAYDWTLGAMFEVLGKLKLGADCSVCVLNSDNNYCYNCLKALTGALNEDIPGYEQVADIQHCILECSGNPKSHVCDKDEFTCASGPSLYRSFWSMFGVQFKMRMKCDLRTCLLEPAEYIACPFCEVCDNGMCRERQQVGSSQDCFDPEVLVAGDPNAKSGFEGDVVPGQELDYTVEYENVGEGTAYGVYIVDQLDENLDESSLDIQDGGTYIASARLLLWNVGDVAPQAGGKVHFSVRVRDAVPGGTRITNQAVIYFPSVPQETPTNEVVNRVFSLTAHPQSVETVGSDPADILLTGAEAASAPLTYRITKTPLYGSLEGSPPNVTYTAMKAFSGQDEFEFVVSNGITDSEPAKVSITVQPDPSDTVPPSVVSTFPEDGATNISVKETPSTSDPVRYSPALTAVFSEPLEPSTVTGSSFTVSGLAGTVSYDELSRTAIFVPSEALKYETTYTARLLKTIKDKAGNAMTSDVTWKFTTQSELLSAELSLDKGWNLVSFPIAPSNPAAAAVLGEVAGSCTIVWGYQGGKWSMYDPDNLFFNDLGVLTAGYGYWIRMSEPGTLIVEGTAPSESVALKAGWNLAGYNSTQPLPIADALASVAGEVEAVWSCQNGQWSAYIPGSPSPGGLDTLEQGRGYWIKVKKGCTWKLP